MGNTRCWQLRLALLLALVVQGGLAFGAEPAYFAALQLNHFAKPVDLPEVNLSDLEDKSVALRSWQGRVFLLNFWTTW